MHGVVLPEDEDRVDQDDHETDLVRVGVGLGVRLGLSVGVGGEVASAMSSLQRDEVAADRLAELSRGRA